MPTPRKSRWFLRYVLSLAGLAFAGRAVPLSFLPLVLELQFKQSNTVIGIVMALYPLTALITTPYAARLARGTQRIVQLHSLAIILIAIAMALGAAAPYIQGQLGNLAGTMWLALCRALQGAGMSFYLSSNTCLLARMFPDQLTYVIAMTEVAVGSGGQMGRLLGGFLFDFGGLPLPFLCIASVQVVFGLVGFSFRDEATSSSANVTANGHSAAATQKTNKIPWSQLLTPRVCVGAFAIFCFYFVDTFTSATLLQYLVVHLAPVTVGQISVGMSVRGLSYLMTSFLLAQLMHRELVSYESCMITGCVLMFIGTNMLAPQPVMRSVEVLLNGSEPSYASRWVMQISSFFASNTGGAFLFVPSLPLMQSEVRHAGQLAIEQAAEIFVMMMGLGEMLGPICGGWLMQRVGFMSGSFMLSWLVVPVFLLLLGLYDSTAIKARRRNRKSPDAIAHQVAENQDEGMSGVATCSNGCMPNCVAPSDGESNFALRRLPFAIDMKRHAGNDAPGSAPASVFRRPYVSGSEPLLQVGRQSGRISRTPSF